MVQRADGDKALQDIIKYSLFKTKEDLLQQFSKICSITGTRIIVSHMRRTQEGKYEFDFRTDYTDIRIPDDVELESNKYKRQERQNHIPESDYSLKAYCSILYLRPRMQIILRGKKVRTTVIAKSLSKTEVDAYKPHGVPRTIKVTFGFSQNKNHYGIMMYHRNRLIKPYVRVGYQLRANNLGVGVIGVIQCDYLQPTHNKQDFDYTKAYRSSMSALGSKLNDYWNEKKGRAQVNSNVVIPEPREVESVPDQLWVQCDNPECLKWRKLPPNVGTDNLPEKWYCVDHPEGKWRSCDVPEELEDETEESVQPYVKKQKKRLEKELEEKKRKEREAKQMKELELEVRKQELQKKEAEIKRLMQQVQAKGNQQKETMQQRNMKAEAVSPQKLQVKVIGPAKSRHQSTSTSTKSFYVHQTSGRNVILTPVSTHVSPSQTHALKTPTNVIPTRQISQQSPVVLQESVTPNRPILQKPTIPSVITSKSTSQPGVKIVNIMSHGLPAPIGGTQKSSVVIVNNGKVTVAQPGMHPKVSGPPVIIKVRSQAAADQVKYLPTMVPITAVVEPKVVSVQSLAKHGQPSMATATTNLILKSATTPTYTSLRSPTIPKSMAMPGQANPPSTMPRVSALGQAKTQVVQVNNLSEVQQTRPSNYQPLESLMEVNRHAAENTISPVSAVMDISASDFTTTPHPIVERQSVTVADPTPLGHHDVTVNNRYRYIAPSGQPTQSNAASSQLIVLQQVKTETQSVVNNQATAVQQQAQPVVKAEPQNSTIQLTTTTQQTEPVIKTEPQNSTSANISSLKRRNDQSSGSDEPVARKRKPEADVIIIDPPSPQQQETDVNITVSEILPNMDTSTPNMDLIPDADSSMTEVSGKKPEVDKNVPDVDKIIRDYHMVNVDKDVIDEIKTLSPQQQLQTLLNRTQQLKQLYTLRENVLKLLRVLVPELEVDDLQQKYDDQTVDELLKQVLEQAENNEPDDDT